MTSPAPTPAATPETARDTHSPNLGKAWLLLARNQALGFLREPAAAAFNLAVPFFILLVQAAAFGDAKVGKALPDARVVDVLPVSAAVMFVMIIGVFGMGVGLASMIETRTIAGYRLRPGGVGAIISAYGTVLLALTVSGLVASIATLYVAWSLRAPRSLPLFGVVVLLGCVVFLSLGALVAGMAATPRSAQGIASAVFFPLLFLSGALFPLDSFPPALRYVARVLPSSHFADLLAFAWVDSGAPFPWLGLLYLLGLGAASATASVAVLGRSERV